MDARLQRRIQRYGWDRAVEVYEASWREQLAPAQRRLLERAALRRGERVLEVACGTGLVTFPAAEAVGPSGYVLATDLSEGMVSAVREGASSRDLGWLEATRMDAEALDVPEATFDAALCALGLMYVPDPVRALARMRRALRVGGRAVAAVWGARKRCGWAGIFPVVDARVNTEVCPLFFSLGTGDALADAFREAGFREVTLDRLSAVLRYASADEAVGAAFAGGPVALAYSRFEPEVREEAHAEYLDSISPFRDGPGYRIPGEFVVVAGRRPAS